MAEDRSTNRSRDKADKEDAERLQRIDQRVGSGKEDLAEDQSRHRAVDQKIVPFDRRTDGAGNDGTTQMRPMLSLCGGCPNREPRVLASRSGMD
jgi:hypothetical protein